jgi:nitroreductase
LGIDSCPIEGFNRTQVQKILVQAKVLDDNHFDISCMVAFGYRIKDPTEEKTRRALNEITEWVED